MKKSTLNNCFLLLVLAWLCVFCSVGLAKESQTQFIVTQEQLSVWEIGLTRRMEINSGLKNELAMLQQELIESKAALQIAKEELTMLRQELVTSRILLSNQSELLKQTEESYKKSRREPRQEIAAKVSNGTTLAGVAYGRAYRLANTGIFLGLRIGYDWDLDKSEIWATVGW